MNYKNFLIALSFIAIPAHPMLKPYYVKDLRKTLSQSELKQLTHNQELFDAFQKNRCLQKAIHSHKKIFDVANEYLILFSTSPEQYKKYFSFSDAEFCELMKKEAEFRGECFSADFSALKESSARIESLSHLQSVITDYNALLNQLSYNTSFRIAFKFLEGVQRGKPLTGQIKKIIESYDVFRFRLEKQQREFKEYV